MEKQKLVMLPGPTNVPERVMKAMTKPIINHRSPAFGRLYLSVIDKAKKVFQTEKDMLILTSSGTGSLEASVFNLIRKGDNVVVPVFGTFGERVATLVENAGGNVIRVKAEKGNCPKFEEIEEAFEKTKNVKALYVVCTETSTGVKVPWLKEAGELASNYGSFYITDAISHLGGDDLPVDKWNVDICITASQKCLAAPPGLSLISISKRARKFMTDNPPTTLYFNLPRYFEYLEQRVETPYTPSIPLFYALEEALQMVIEEGLENRIERHKRCAKAFYSAFEAMGLKLFADKWARSNTVLSIAYKDGVDDIKFRTMLDEEFDVLVAGSFGELKGKIFRIGNMGIVSELIVERTVKAIAQALKKLNVNVDEEKAINVIK
jgi:aspartate aminotransferase-like enzyme